MAKSSKATGERLWVSRSGTMPRHPRRNRGRTPVSARKTVHRPHGEHPSGHLVERDPNRVWYNVTFSRLYKEGDEWKIATISAAMTCSSCQSR